MLVFLGAMCGLCLTGDLFNLFVWFELMTAAGVALCGYKSEESQPLQGALNFAVTNTVGAFLSLTGVALLYAFTGSLNMSEVGRAVAANSPDDRFLTVAFLFVIAGFLAKSAAFPFHFWLADAHAVAPTPVCILFSGVMVELGIYAIARIYWLVFATSPQHAPEAIRTVFLSRRRGNCSRWCFILLRPAASEAFTRIFDHESRRTDADGIRVSRSDKPGRNGDLYRGPRDDQG